MKTIQTIALAACLSMPMLASATTSTTFTTNNGNPNIGTSVDGGPNIASATVTGNHDFVTTLPGANGGFFSDVWELVVSGSDIATISFTGLTNIDLFNVAGKITSTTPKLAIGPSSAPFTFAGLTANTYSFKVSGNKIAGNNPRPSYGVSVSAVPVPAAVWLMGTALAGLVGFRKRKAGLAA